MKKNKKDQEVQKNWFARHKIISVVIGLFVLMVIISAFGGNDTQKTNILDREANKGFKSDVSDDQKEYKTIFSTTVSGQKKTESFILNSNKQKLIYKQTGNEFALCYVYIVDESISNSTGSLIAMIDHNTSGDTILRNSPGIYYFDIMSVNGTCDIELQELR